MKNAIQIILIISLHLCGCKSYSSNQYIYRSPENIEDGLNVDSVEEVNIGVRLIEKVVNEIHRGKFIEIHSMLVYRNNRLVLEEYFTGININIAVPTIMENY